MASVNSLSPMRAFAGEGEYAARIPYPDRVSGGSWPEEIAIIKRHIADLREMIANE